MDMRNWGLAARSPMKRSRSATVKTSSLLLVCGEREGGRKGGTNGMSTLIRGNRQPSLHGKEERDGKEGGREDTHTYLLYL